MGLVSPFHPLSTLERALSTRRFHTFASLVAVPVLIACASCAGVKNLLSTSNDGEATFVQVDDLMGRIERIHVDCELARQNIAATTDALRVMVDPEFRGDPALAHGDLVAALELSERQAEDLQSDYNRMTASAKRVFSQWQENLESFSSESMREHSAARMEATRARYEAVLNTVGPAMELYRGFNSTMRDHTLYFGTDFNDEAVRLVEREIRVLFREAEALRADFIHGTEACQAYVRKATPRSQAAPGGRREV